MSLRALLTVLLATAPVIKSTQVSVAYDFTYDDPSNPLTKVACSDGENGLMTKYGFQTIGDIPSDVASSSTVSGWNSEVCGACYSLQYDDQVIYVLAVDSKPDGIDLSQSAMDRLTKGRAYELGRVNAELLQVGVDRCGLASKRGLEWYA